MWLLVVLSGGLSVRKMCHFDTSTNKILTGLDGLCIVPREPSKHPLAPDFGTGIARIIDIHVLLYQHIQIKLVA